MQKLLTIVVPVYRVEAKKNALTRFLCPKSIMRSFHNFFKECKQHLYLGKCHSHNFDAQIASFAPEVSFGYKKLYKTDKFGKPKAGRIKSTCET